MEWGDDEEHFPPPPAADTSQVIHMNGDATATPGIKCIALYAYAVSPRIILQVEYCNKYTVGRILQSQLTRAQTLKALRWIN
jgi:hypothetical protein